MVSMTPRQRLMAVLEFQPVDRVPLMDYSYWFETIEAWHQQGLSPEITRFDEGYFSLDRGYKQGVFHPYDTPGAVDGFYPPFELKILRDEGDKVVMRDEEGVILRQQKRMRTIPQYLRFPVENRADYEALRWRLNGADAGRYPDGWDQYMQQMVATKQPICLRLNGFFNWPRKLMGLEGLCLAYYDQPDLVETINADHLQFLKDLSLTPLGDLPVDYALILEDLAYRGGPFIGPDVFRHFITPYYQELNDFLRQHGVRKILVDTDGDVRDVVALFIEVGVDGILPCERAAGSDPIELRRRYPCFALLGGVDKRALIAGPEAIDQELAHLSPVIAGGGYIPGVDHQVPPDVPLAHYLYFCQRRKEVLAEIC
jgi:uroporphyrinogen decarboxylase